MVNLKATPEVALADEPVRIHAWGLPPQQLITLRAWVKDENVRMFRSQAFYKTDADGKVDLDHTPAIGGDFTGDGPIPGVIDMFGGVGGLVGFRSGLLASCGFASLALAYFAYDDLPKFLRSVDLTYFEEAAQILMRNPKMLSGGVGVVAVCKGAEIALAMASYLPQVKAAVCINKTNAINGNSLTYGDLFIQGIPYEVEKVVVTDIGAVDISHMMADTKKPEYQDCILPLEKAKCPILFLVGEKDQNYDRFKFAKEALARAQKFSKHDVYVHSFPRSRASAGTTWNTLLLRVPIPSLSHSAAVGKRAGGTL